MSIIKLLQKMLKISKLLFHLLKSKSEIKFLKVMDYEESLLISALDKVI